jgi:hypothetical protein
LNGKGGGKPESAQASGNNVSALSEALRVATDYANAKLGVAFKPSSTPTSVAPAAKAAPAAKPVAPPAAKAVAPTAKSAGDAYAVSFDPKAPFSHMIQAISLLSNKQVTFTPGPPATPLTLTLADKTQLSGLNAVATFLASQQLNGDTDALSKSQVLQWLYFAQNHLVHYVSAAKGKSLVRC